MRFELGRKAKDRITGFQGTITGRVEYLTGCNQALLAPVVGDDGSLKDSQWFDEQRLEYLGEDRIELNNGASPGFDRAAPKR